MIAEHLIPESKIGPSAGTLGPINLGDQPFSPSTTINHVKHNCKDDFFTPEEEYTLSMLDQLCIEIIGRNKSTGGPR